MFLTTLLSALPLLNPALPVQEPVNKTGQKCTCSAQEPVAKSKTTRTKIGKTARKNANKTKRIHGKTSVNRSVVNKQIAGNTKRTPTDVIKKHTQFNLRRANGADGTQVDALALVETGVPQDNSPMWNDSDSSIIIWGSNPKSPVDALEKVDTTNKKPAKKQNANKQVRKNRKR